MQGILLLRETKTLMAILGGLFLATDIGNDLGLICFPLIDGELCVPERRLALTANVLRCPGWPTNTNSITGGVMAYGIPL